MGLQKTSSDDELLEFIIMRGLGFTTDELDAELDTVGSVIYSRRKRLRERFKSSEYDDAVEFLKEELLPELDEVDKSFDE